MSEEIIRESFDLFQAEIPPFPVFQVVLVKTSAFYGGDGEMLLSPADLVVDRTDWSESIN